MNFLYVITDQALKSSVFLSEIKITV